ncbi:MAG: M20/M25/M40 family metallo-hydrolase [Verrucomicrobiales bacterium]|nr:M20/M25/M40 family metallo-hydrolase [Verrucomicrobiales bacterium]
MHPWSWIPVIVLPLLLQPPILAAQPGSTVRIEDFAPSPNGVSLRWTGGDGPFAVERAHPVSLGTWETDLTTTQRTATLTLPVNAPAAFYRVVDVGAGVPEVDAFLVARNATRFPQDLANLVRTPTFRDDSPDSEERTLRNLASIQSYLQARVEAFNQGQRTLKIVPFDWKANVNGVARWVFGFRVGSGPKKFSIYTHLDTVSPGEGSWQPFEPRIEIQPYRGSSQEFLIGRGAIDDKGPAVISLSVLEAAAKRYDGRTEVDPWTLEVAFDTNEEQDFNIPAYLDATGGPELGIVFDAFWTVRAEKGVERPVFHFPLGETSSAGLKLQSLVTSPGSVNQIPDHAYATIVGIASDLDAFAATVTNQYAAFAFDDPSYRRAAFAVARTDSAVILTTTVAGAQHGSAPAENRERGANPLVSLANFVAGLANNGTLATNGPSRLAQFIAWGWGTRVFGENHPDLLQRSDSVFTEGNGTTYALTRVTTNASSASLAIDIRYAQGHQSVPWDGVTDGLLGGTSLFPGIFTNLVQRFLSIQPDAGVTFQTVNHGFPDIRDPDGESFRQIRAAYEEVTGKPCPLYAIGGGSDAHAYPNLVAAGALFSEDFDPPINYHGSNEGAPLDDLRLSARILWQVLLRKIGDPAGNQH